MEAVFQNIIGYLNALDWGYIITFILISYAINYYKVTQWIVNGLGISIRTRYRVLIIGIVYAVFIFFIRGYRLMGVERLLQSFVFAVVFHKFILELLLERIFPKKEQLQNHKEQL
jgi:hypothetical protein